MPIPNATLLTSDDRHFRQSSHREFILEVAFLGELLRHLWCAKATGVQVLYPARDDAGYDLAVEANGMLRYIQLKGMTQRRNVRIHRNLIRKRGACAVGMIFNRESLTLHHFYWFGGKPDDYINASEMKEARSLRRNRAGERSALPNIFVLPSSRFSNPMEIGALVEKLFPKIDEV